MEINYCSFTCGLLNGLPGDGRIVLEDDRGINNGNKAEENDEVPAKRQRTDRHPVDLELDVVLGKMPRKVTTLIIASESKLCVIYTARLIPTA